MKTHRMIFIALFMVLTVMVAGAFAAGGTQSQSQAGQTMGQSQYPVKAGDLMGKSINSNDGKEVGEISDLVIDQDGRIQYVVLKPSGDLEKDNQLLPVPWHSIQAGAGEKDTLTLAVDMQKLKNAPTISEDQWENITSQDIETQVRGYYGTESMQPGMMHQKTPGSSGGMQDKY